MGVGIEEKYYWCLNEVEESKYLWKENIIEWR